MWASPRRSALIFRLYLIREQDLKSTGVPVDAIAVGDIVPDARTCGLDGL
jgi:hypothetical protein